MSGNIHRHAIYTCMHMFTYISKSQGGTRYHPKYVLADLLQIRRRRQKIDVVFAILCGLFAILVFRFDSWRSCVLL